MDKVNEKNNSSNQLRNTNKKNLCKTMSNKTENNNKIPHKCGTSNKSIQLIEKLSNQIIEMKLDNVLDEIKTIDKKCDFNKCKTKTSLIGQDCLLCKQRFCFKHCLPEIHGCALAVKQEEREKFLHPKPLKTIRQEQDLKDAKKRLNAKLKDMQVCRMQKTHASKTKK